MHYREPTPSQSTDQRSPCAQEIAALSSDSIANPFSLTESVKAEAEYDLKSPLERITKRELEVLQLTVEGKSAAEIARNLSLTPGTVATYRWRLMHKLGLSDLPSLVKFSIQQGLTPPL